MVNHFTYIPFITYTVSNDIFHSIMILLDFLLCVSSPSFLSVIKIHSFWKSPNNQGFRPNSQLFNILYYTHWNDPNTIIHFIIFIITVIFLIVYFIIVYYFSRLKEHFNIKKKSFLLSALINFYDIIYFRYFTIIFIDSFFSLSFTFIRSNNLLGGFYTFCLIIIFMIYFLATLDFILVHHVFVNILNPLLVDKPKKYPYDSISKEYDIIMLFIKVAISLEYNTCVNGMETYYEALIFNMIIYLSLLLLCFRLLFLYWFKYSPQVLYANIWKNCLRKYIIIFDCLSLTFLIISYDDNTTAFGVYSSIIFAMIITLMLFFYELFHVNYYLYHNNTLNYEGILLVLIKNAKEERTRNQLKLMQDNLFLTHIRECHKKECIICTSFSNDLYKNNQLYYTYLTDNHNLQKIKNQSNNNYKRSHYSKKIKELITLFFYQIKRNTMMYMMELYSLIREYEKKDINYVNIITVIFEYWLNKDDTIQSQFMSSIKEIDSLEKRVNGTLDHFQRLMTEEVPCCLHVSVYSLATELRDTVDYMKDFSKRIDLKDDLLSQDNTIKLTNSVFKFNFTLMRFIIENLLNQDLSDMPPLNIELLDDYLNTHFTYDNLLILSMDLSAINKEIKIIKASGELGHDHPTSLSDFYSDRLKQKAVDLFIFQLKLAKSKAIERTTDAIITPLKTHDVLLLIKYSFHLAETFIKDSIIIYGNYTKEVSNCIILDFMSDPNEIIIIDACKEFYNLLQFKPSWINLLKACHISLTIKNVFKTIQIETGVLKCEFEYDYYIYSLRKMIRKISTNEDYKKSGKVIIDELRKSIENITKMLGKSIMIIFNKIDELDGGKFELYHSNMKAMKITNSSISKEKDINNKDYEYDHDTFLPFNHSQTYSSSSVIDNSYISTSYSKKTKGLEFQVVDPELKKRIANETKHLSMFSLLMIILNVSLIVLCTIFLITQIIQTNLLSQANQFLFEWKTLRIVNGHFFMSIAASVCFVYEADDKSCENDYKKYTKYFQETFGMSKDFDFVDYLFTEVKYKADYTQGVLTKLKESFYLSGNQEYIDILNQPMSYFVFQQKESEISLATLQVTFEEGLMRFINSIYIICHSPDNPAFIPLYFITFQDGTYLFNNVPNQTLTIVQEEIYKELINYMNFASSFYTGESILQNSLNRLRNQNNVINTLFMICIALLNVILFILCIGNIKTAYSLFKVLIVNVLSQIEDSTFSKYFKDKINHLIVLSKVYSKNPNTLIKELKDGRNHYISHLHNMTDSHNKQSLIDSNIIRETSALKLKKSLSVHYGQHFYLSITMIYIIALLVVFGLYFIIIIILDIMLSISFTKLFDIYEYVYLQYVYENAGFVNLAFAHLVAILNITNADLAVALNRPNPEDGVLNFLVKDSYAKFELLLSYKSRNDPVSFPSLSNHVDYHCDTVLNSISDHFIDSVSNELGKKYQTIPGLICNAYDLLNLGGFTYLLIDIKKRTHQLINSKQGNDYPSITTFITNMSLYEAYTIILIFYRPLCTYFRNHHLLPILTHSFDDYVIFVGVYLCVNIILEVIIFGVIKWFVINNLEAIQRNLYLLNNCVN